eukprot:GHVL01012415.1.p1 GENE.GHVL01012415.1~~GHVL01012415.1.p1  ORF type:complete len:215 (+),score=63.26 GHVL01012415.1:53-697(+)
MSSLVKYDPPILMNSVKDQSECRRMLNKLLEPKIRNENNQVWVQLASTTPATDADVLILKNNLNKRLYEVTDDSCICPLREEIYKECFDEIIRQIAIVCYERGHLLQQVRDEFKLTITSYKKLFESVTSYGLRKLIYSKQINNDMIKNKEKLKENNMYLQEEVERLENEIELFKSQIGLEIEQERIKHFEEVASIKEVNESLKRQLEDLMLKAA